MRAPNPSRDLFRAIRAAGIYYDDLIEEVANRLQATRQIMFLVADDHRQADGSDPKKR